VRGGYTLLGSIYIGGQFLYHFGTTQETGLTKTTVKSFLFGVEGGYPVSTGPVIVRPYLGIGLIKVNATASFSGLFPDQDAGFTKIYFVPGTTVLYPLGKSFVGADARYIDADRSYALTYPSLAGSTSQRSGSCSSRFTTPSFSPSKTAALCAWPRLPFSLPCNTPLTMLRGIPCLTAQLKTETPHRSNSARTSSNVFSAMRRPVY